MTIDLRQGDCLEEMKKLESGSVNCIITDPPFSFPVAQFRPEARIKQRTFGDFSTYQHFFSQFLDESIRLLEKDGDIYVFCDETFYAVLFPLFYSRFYSTKLLVWDKGRIGMGGMWRRRFELILHARMNPAKKKSGDSDILLFKPIDGNNKLHNSQKPVDLIEKLIVKNTEENHIVLDSFMGSGSTGVASKNLNRNFIGIELDEGYFNIAKSRIEKEANLGTDTLT